MHDAYGMVTAWEPYRMRGRHLTSTTQGEVHARLPERAAHQHGEVRAREAVEPRGEAQHLART